MKPRAVPILALILALLAAPLTVEAQQARKLARVGVLAISQTERFTAFMQALREAGYVHGENVLVETRFYEGNLDRLPTLAHELVTLQCDVIVATGPEAIRAATRATTTTPIVGIDLESDPVASGWARSLGHPEGNVTGLFLDMRDLVGKQIELLTGDVPGLSRVGVMWDSAIGGVQFRAAESAARAAGVTLLSLPVQGGTDFAGAFDRAAREHLRGVVLLSSPSVSSHASQIAGLALKTRLPTINLFTWFAVSGGLMAYGPPVPDLFKRAAIYVSKVLNGAKVGDLPIERPERFELVINLKTARALGLTIPPSLLLRADEVIQ